MTVILENVRKTYLLDATHVPAVRGLSLTFGEGEFTALAGPSGCGKTTILNMIGCIDTPTEGSISIDGQNVTHLSDSALTQLRLKKIGFIFQNFNLISVLNVYQNIEFPLLLMKNLSSHERKERVESLIEAVGLTKYQHHRANQLSGGQRQRVAIARALVTKPSLVLADEPTANLDSETGDRILQLMKTISQERGTSFLFSTHDPKILHYASRVIYLLDGKVVSDSLKGESLKDTQRGSL